MATREAKKEEAKVVKPITIVDKATGNPKYVLEFDRATIRQAEKEGFRIESVVKVGNEDQESGLNMAISPIEDLFYHSFKKHQPHMNKNATNQVLYEELKGLTPDALTRLIELYMIPFNTLISTDEEKNALSTMEL